MLGDNDVDWHINPYFRMNLGGGDFRFGFLYQGLAETWKLATSMVVSF